MCLQFYIMHTLRGSFFEPHYLTLVSNSLLYCTHIKLIVKVKKGEIVSLEEVYTILKFWSLIINLIKLIFPLSVFQVLLVLNYPSLSGSFNSKSMQENSSFWLITTLHHDRDMKHHGRDKAITIGISSIASQKCQSCHFWAAHDPCHDREQAPPAREDKQFIHCIHSGVLTIYSHDRDPAPWARDQAAFFIA